MITTSKEYEWDHIYPPTRGVSHRSTTSSRHPGRAIEGSVGYVLVQQTTCPDCGGIRRASLNPHAPRWKRIPGGWMQVDCAGRPVFSNRSRNP
jgi:hypothetical protein